MNAQPECKMLAEKSSVANYLPAKCQADIPAPFTSEDLNAVSDILSQPDQKEEIETAEDVSNDIPEI